jgi:hypothetical protein
MRRGPIVALALAPLLSAGGAAALELDPEAILHRAEQVRSPAIDYAVDFRLDVVDPTSAWKERSARYTMIAHGKDHSLVLMRDPEFHPGTLLISDGLYWLLLPRTSKPLQLTARHVLDGDISNGDLARGNLAAHYKPRLDGEEEVDGEPCYRLDLVRKSSLGTYPRIRAFITRNGTRPKAFEYYGMSGALLKIARYEDYREGPIGLRSMRIEVESRVRPAERSTLTFHDLRPIDASAFSFTHEALPAFRDAALAVFEAEGRQARAERIAEVLRGRSP